MIVGQLDDQVARLEPEVWELEVAVVIRLAESQGTVVAVDC